MKRLQNISMNSVIRFHRWSRKRFASFCSLGRIVVIARVKNAIADASMTKQNGYGLSDIDLFISSSAADREEPDIPPLYTLLSQVTVLLPTTSSDAAADRYICIRLKAGQPKEYSLWLTRFSFWLGLWPHILIIHSVFLIH